MDKKLQMYVGLGVVAVAGYLLWKKSQKTTPKTDSETSPAAAKSFASLDAKIAGQRKGMVGMDATMKQNAEVKDGKFSYFSAQNEVSKDGSWAKAEGDNIAPNFFKVHDSENSFRSR